MQQQIHNANRVIQGARSPGLTRLAAGLARLPTGLRVKPISRPEARIVRLIAVIASQ
jgi:hypothetical protein